MPRKSPEPAIQFLEECFVCDPVVGTLHWRERPVSHFKTIRAASIFNKRRAGKRAGSVSDKGYWIVGMTIYGKRRLLQVHRIIWAMTTGEWPPAFLDHINVDQSDNRIENLRPATYSENFRNRGPQRNNKCGLKGVYKNCNAFQAEIKDSNGNAVYLGRYKTPEAAHEAYKVAALKYHGAFARVA